MNVSQRFHRWLRGSTAPLVGLVLVATTVQHTLNGERGLSAVGERRQAIEQAQQELTAVKAERDALERRVVRLRDDNLDPDLLEERARAMLGWLHPADRVIVQPAARTTDRRTP